MFTDKEIRKDHFQKTHTTQRVGRRTVTREAAGIEAPQGKKFVDCNILGISNYVRIDNPSKGTVIRRRRVSK